MGIRASCDVARYSNSCAVGGCVEKVTGIPLTQGEAHAAEIWECEMEPGAKIDGKAYPKILIKWGLTPPMFDKMQYPEHAMAPVDIVLAKQASMGLLYELLVHDRILYWVVGHICPFFVKSLSMSRSCTFGDLWAILVKFMSYESKIKGVSFEDASENLIRVILTLYIQHPKRQTINFVNDRYLPNLLKVYMNGVDFGPVATHSKFSMLIIEHRETRNYENWLRSNAKNEAKDGVLIQLFIALIVMGKAKMTHNNLQCTNILIEQLADVHRYEFKFSNMPEIAFNTQYRLMIDDFTSATAVSLGTNLNVPQFDASFDPQRDITSLCRSLCSKRLFITSRLAEHTSFVCDDDQTPLGPDPMGAMFAACQQLARTLDAGEAGEAGKAASRFNVRDIYFDVDGSISVDQDMDRLDSELAKYASEKFKCETTIAELTAEIESQRKKTARMWDDKQEVCRGNHVDPAVREYCGV